MTAGARRRLARAQSALVDALLAGGTAPAGFDPERVRVEAAALLAKRRRVAERLRPDLADALGDRFAQLFDAWASANPPRAGVGAREDAAGFAEWAERHGHLPRARRRWRQLWRR